MPQPPRSQPSTAQVGAGAAVVAAPFVTAEVAPAITSAARLKLTGVALTRVVRGLIGVFDELAEKRFRDDGVFTMQELGRQYPDRRPSEWAKLVAQEEKFEREFRRKMRERLDRDLPDALALNDPEQRMERLKQIFDREKTYTVARSEAMFLRALGKAEAITLKAVSPEGAYWKLSPFVKEHTLDCLAMGEKFWPWEVLDDFQPPVHHGCACSLHSLDDAVAEGWMNRDQVPDTRDAIMRARKALIDAAEMEETLEESEIRAYIDSFALEGAHNVVAIDAPKADGNLSLLEAKTKNTGAMVALYPSRELAKKLAVDGGEPVEQLHITLAFLGKAADLKDKDKLMTAVQGFAATCPPLSGEISGVGLFTAGPDPVAYASVDLPRLPGARERLVAALKGAGAPPANDHGFTPHMTLAYDKDDSHLGNVPFMAAEVPTPKLRFDKITLKLGDRRLDFPLRGEELEEGLSTLKQARWGKGLSHGGRFRPQRGGGDPGSRILRALFPRPRSPLAMRGEKRGRWTWVNGVHTRIPEADQWAKRVAGHDYSSPAGSTNVYRDGKLFDGLGMESPEKRPRITAGPQATPEAVRVEADKLRAGMRDRAVAQISASPARPPIAEGDGATSLLALKQAGWQVQAASPGTDGMKLRFRHPGTEATVDVGYDGERVNYVGWSPAPAPVPVGHHLSHPPQSWDEHRADAYAWAREIAEEHGTEAHLTSLKIDHSLTDHAGVRYWTGETDLGPETDIDIDRAGRARAAGRELTDDEKRGVWSAYWVTAHEAVAHAVNPMEPFLYHDHHANLEEALAEELAHIEAVKRLQGQGQEDVLAWRMEHPQALAVRGVYRRERGALAGLLDRAGIMDPFDRRVFLEDLKFRTEPSERFVALAEALRRNGAEGTDDELLHEAESAMETPEDERPGSVLDMKGHSPGYEQVGRSGYGRFKSAVLSEDGKTLRLNDGSFRRLEKLPVLHEGLNGLTEGWAVAHYPEGQRPTDGVHYADGSPKNFRYVDSEERGKLILEAFKGMGAPGTSDDELRDLVARLTKKSNLNKAMLLGAFQDAVKDRATGKPKRMSHTMPPASAKAYEKGWEMAGEELSDGTGTPGTGVELARGPLFAAAEALGRDHPLWKPMRLAHAAGEPYQLSDDEAREVLAVVRDALKTPRNRRTNDEVMRAIAATTLRSHFGEIDTTPKPTTRRQLDGSLTVHLKGNRVGSVSKVGKKWEADHGEHVTEHATQKEAIAALVTPPMQSPGTNRELFEDGDSRESLEQKLREAGPEWATIKGVPVKRRFDGSYGVGNAGFDGRHLSGVAGENAAVAVALKRAEMPSTWAPPAMASPGTGGGKHWWEKLIGSGQGDLFPDEDALWDAFKDTETKKNKTWVDPLVGKAIEADPNAPEPKGILPNYDRTALFYGKAAGGSNGARFAFDEDGRRWLIKGYRGDRDRIATELLANAVYRTVGAKAAVAGTKTMPPREPDFRQIPDKEIEEPELPKKQKGRRLSTGILVAEPDGRIWIYEPKGHFGGYEHTFPKGGLEHGLTAQQNALKELHEETGLHAHITGHLGDYEGDTGVTRMYLAVRTGGEPLADDPTPHVPHSGAETASVKLVSPDAAADMLNRDRDKAILSDALKLGLPKGEFPDEFPDTSRPIALVYPTEDGEERTHFPPSEKVGEHYMADALLANWDFVGMTGDNILWGKDGEPIRLDQGGTFELRAQGGFKPYGPVPTEVWTMLSKGQGKRGVIVTEEQMRAQAAELGRKLSGVKIDKLVDQVPFEDEEMRERIRENMKARVAWMRDFAAGKIELPKPFEGDEAHDALFDGQKDLRLYPEQEDALYAFVEGLSKEINSALKGKGKKADRPKPVQAAIDELDSLFRHAETTDDVIGWVPIDLGGTDGSQFEGKSLQERGFMGLELDRPEADGVLRLTVPEGSAAIYAGMFEDMPVGTPPLIAARDAKVKVTGRRVEDGQVILDGVLSTQRAWKPLKPLKPKPKLAGEGKPDPKWWATDPKLGGKDVEEAKVVHAEQAERDELYERFPHVKAKDARSGPSVSLAKDAQGFYVHTHRARSKSYPTVAKIPASAVKFIESTG